MWRQLNWLPADDCFGCPSYSKLLSERIEGPELLRNSGSKGGVCKPNIVQRQEVGVSAKSFRVGRHLQAICTIARRDRFARVIDIRRSDGGEFIQRPGGHAKP